MLTNCTNSRAGVVQYYLGFPHLGNLYQVSRPGPHRQRQSETLPCPIGGLITFAYDEPTASDARKKPVWGRGPTKAATLVRCGGKDCSNLECEYPYSDPKGPPRRAGESQPPGRSLYRSPPKYSSARVNVGGTISGADWPGSRPLAPRRNAPRRVDPATLSHRLPVPSVLTGPAATPAPWQHSPGGCTAQGWVIWKVPLW